MQAISKKYDFNADHRERKASDRFDARVEIARQVSRNVTALNGKLCDSLMKEATKSMYGRTKR